MIKHIRNIANNIYRHSPNIMDSKVSNPSMINATADVLESNIMGNVRVHEFAKITRSQMQGNIVVSANSKIIDAQIGGTVSIGRWTTLFGPNSEIWAIINKVYIGNFCSIARNVSILEYNHPIDRMTSYLLMKNFFGESMDQDIESKGDISIGNDVWIGTQSMILSGSVISDGVVIGANSVVNSFIPPFAIAVGSPAKVVGYRFNENLIQKLIKLEWWNWSNERIRDNRKLFEGTLTDDKLEQFVLEN